MTKTYVTRDEVLSKIDTCVEHYQKENRSRLRSGNPSMAVVSQETYLRLDFTGLSKSLGLKWVKNEYGDIIGNTEERGIVNTQHLPINLFLIDSLPERERERLRRLCGDVQSPLVLARLGFWGGVKDIAVYGFGSDVSASSLAQAC